jgi:hypothetical protein
LSTSTSGYQSFMWSNNGKTGSVKFLAGDLGPKGTYIWTLEARKNNGCVETDTVYISTKDNNIGVYVQSFTHTIQLYPQPAGELIYIKGGNIARIDLLSLQGILIRSLQLKEGVRSIVVNDLSSGIYIMELSSPDGQVARLKWLKE